MKQRENRLLRRRLEVNQQIPAGDQIELGKRCVTNDVMRREHNALAQVLRDLIAVRTEREKLLATFGCDALNLFLGVDAGAGDFE